MSRVTASYCDPKFNRKCFILIALVIGYFVKERKLVNLLKRQPQIKEVRGGRRKLINKECH